MLARSGAAGAPANLIDALTAWPSGRYPPDCSASGPPSLQPVRCGLTEREHDPGSSDGAVGGSGSSVTLTGSGFGGGGSFPSAGTTSAATGVGCAITTAPNVIAHATAETNMRRTCWFIAAPNPSAR